MRRSAPRREIPPPLELRCLKALWSLNEATVAAIHQALSGGQPLAYTTVLTLLDRLEKRGVVTRRKSGRLLVYAPKIARDRLRGVALSEFVRDWFDGSQDALLAYLEQLRSRAASEPERRAEVSAS